MLTLSILGQLQRDAARSRIKEICLTVGLVHPPVDSYVGAPPLCEDNSSLQ